MRYLIKTFLFFLITSNLNSQELNLTAENAYFAYQKMICGTTEEGATRYGTWEGKAYSRVPGEKDRHIFNLVGINVRQCLKTNDEVRGKGFRSVSREIQMYLDPETNKVIDTWKNPWTNDDISVLHVANDPVNMRGISYEFDEEGNSTREMKVRRYSDVIVSPLEIPLFYKNALGGEYQKYVGGMYHAMEIFNSFYNAEKLLDDNIQSIDESHGGWTRVAQWLPWMEMGDKPGIMIFNASVFNTFELNDVPEKIRKILDARYPEYIEPPPLNDDRPNETSWTVFKKQLKN